MEQSLGPALQRERLQRRELVRRLPERLDWLWFLGFGLEDEVPNHSVLSKARARWVGDDPLFSSKPLERLFRKSAVKWILLFCIVCGSGGKLLPAEQPAASPPTTAAIDESGSAPNADSWWMQQNSTMSAGERLQLWSYIRSDRLKSAEAVERDLVVLRRRIDDLKLGRALDPSYDLSIGAGQLARMDMEALERAVKLYEQIRNHFRQLVKNAEVQVAAAQKEIEAAKNPAPGDDGAKHGVIVGGLASYRETAAGRIATKRGLRLLRIEVPGYIRKDPAETDKSFDALIEMAEQAKVLLFIDKADILFGGAKASASPAGLEKVHGGALLKKLEQAPGGVILGLVAGPENSAKLPGWDDLAPRREYINEDLHQQ